MFGLCNEYNLDMLILALPISVGGIGIFVGCYFALKYIPQKWLDAISNTFDTAKQKLKSLLKIKKA